MEADKADKMVRYFDFELESPSWLLSAKSISKLRVMRPGDGVKVIGDTFDFYSGMYFEVILTKRGNHNKTSTIRGYSSWDADGHLWKRSIR